MCNVLSLNEQQPKKIQSLEIYEVYICIVEWKQLVIGSGGREGESEQNKQKSNIKF